MPIRIVLVDDHVLVRQGLRSLLEREGLLVIGEAADGVNEAVRPNGRREGAAARRHGPAGRPGVRRRVVNLERRGDVHAPARPRR